MNKISLSEPPSVKSAEDTIIRLYTFMLITMGDNQIFGRSVTPKTVKIPKMTQQSVREVRFQENGTIHSTILNQEDTLSACDTYGIARIPLRFGRGEGMHKEQI